MGQRGVGEGELGCYFVDSLLQTRASAGVVVEAVEAVVIWGQPTVNVQTEEEAAEAEAVEAVAVGAVAVVVQEHPQ